MSCSRATRLHDICDGPRCRVGLFVALDAESQRIVLSNTSAFTHAHVFEDVELDQKRAMLGHLEAFEKAAMFHVQPHSSRAELMDLSSTDMKAELFSELEPNDQVAMAATLDTEDIDQMLQCQTQPQRKELLDRSPAETTAAVFTMMRQDRRPEMLSDLDVERRAHMFGRLSVGMQAQMLELQSPTQKAGLFSVMNTEQQRVLLNSEPGPDARAELFEALPDKHHAQMVAVSRTEERAAMFTELGSKGRTDMLSVMSPPECAAMYVLLAPAEQKDMVSLMGHSEQGRLLVTLPSDDHRKQLLAQMGNKDKAAMFGKLGSEDQKKMLAISFDAEATAAMFAISTREQQAAILDALAVHERLALFDAMLTRQRQSFLQCLKRPDIEELFQMASDEQRTAILHLLLIDDRVKLFFGLDCEYQYSMVVLSSVQSQVSMLDHMSEQQQPVYLATFKPTEMLVELFAHLPDKEQRANLISCLTVQDQNDLLVNSAPEQQTLMITSMSEVDQATLLMALHGDDRAVMLSAMSPQDQACLLASMDYESQQAMLSSMDVPGKVELFVVSESSGMRTVIMDSAALADQVEMFTRMPREQHREFLDCCDGHRLLEIAVVKEDLELVKSLLSDGVSPNQPGILSLQPLVLGALGSGYAEDLIFALVSAGGDSGVDSLSDQSPLTLALHNEHPPVARLLLEQATDEVLWSVAQRVPVGHPLRCEIFEKCLQELDTAPISEDYYRARMLVLAQTQASIRSLDDHNLQCDGRPLLHWAVYYNNEQLLRSLLGSSHDFAQQAQWVVKQCLGGWLHVTAAIHELLFTHADVESADCAKSLAAARSMGNRRFLNAAFDRGVVESAHVQTSWFSAGRPKEDSDVWGLDASFPPSLQSLCSGAAAAPMKHIQVEWIRAQDIQSFDGGKVQLPEASSSSLEPGLFGSLFYWSAMLGLIEDKAVSVQPKNSRGLYSVRLPGCDPVEVDDWIPCVGGRPAFGSVGSPMISSLLITKAMAKRLGSFDRLIELNLLAEQTQQSGFQALEHIASLPSVAFAAKLTDWGVKTDFHGVVDAFWWSMHHSDLLSSSPNKFLRTSDLRTAEASALYFVSPLVHSTAEHTLVIRIQLDVPDDVRLTLQSVDGQELVTEVLSELSPSVCTEVVIENAHFVQNVSLMITLEQASQNKQHRNHMCVEFSSTDNTLAVQRSQYSIL
eukprot:TRINITY_DN44531_c0_g1_i1.p1 TRINITY_DN44531_c0_g1~~TRINITY_DN44531_c0_g1_i1.p1  ORF type:complete len:1191 (-),score=298.73 TRINITY_DN44531_c0_g1_i1:177-3749(-)